MDLEQPKFSRKVIQNGSSLVITLPQEVLQYLEIEFGDEIEMIAKKGNKGRYAAFWKKEKRMKVWGYNNDNKTIFQ